ncbi:OmpH family outer membrane protein [Ferriphaselus sp. R-1]|uniref:OmpH family outer membrane protein n=1 Tax=Ferriphaselus sp. R-1 TaxID=1485544 RepID=UPI00054D7714|nr:OmpH family outer membrane protein [Ferriphaselus sp. R-1]
MPNMIRLLFATLLLSASSQLVAADFRVGVVDTERILRESVPATKAESKLEKEFSARDQEIKRLLKQAKDIQATLEKDVGSPPDAAHRSKERELANLNSNLQRMQREYNEDLNLRKSEELAIVLEQASKALQTIAEADKFDLVLDVQSRVFHTPKIDITDKVLKFLAAEEDKAGKK